MERRSFVLVGAGPVGTLMALLLARRGEQVQLIERRPDPRARTPGQGRSINLALAARGIRALEHCALMERVRPLLVPMRGRMLHDEHGARQFHPYGRSEQEVLYATGREPLTRALLEAALECAAIEVLFGQRCLDVDPAAGTVRMRCERSGQERSVPFQRLLATDGAGSAVRGALVARRLAQVDEQPLAHDYKELLIAATAAAGGTGVPPLERQALHIWPRGGFMLIALPNSDGSFTATLFLPRTGKPGFDQLDDSAAVRAFFDAEFPDAARLLPDLAEQFKSHPQGRLGGVRCTPWQWRERVLLLGDAAHAIVPFHGQGLNCGFEDCLQLEQLLSSPATGATAFSRFERARRADTEAIAAMSLDNYVEMRQRVRSEDFARRQALAAQLQQRFPARFLPRYSMVMFHPTIPYAEALRRGERQRALLDRLCARLSAGASLEAALADADSQLEQAGL